MLSVARALALAFAAAYLALTVGVQLVLLREPLRKELQVTEDKREACKAWSYREAHDVECRHYDGVPPKWYPSELVVRSIANADWCVIKSCGALTWSEMAAATVASVAAQRLLL